MTHRHVLALAGQIAEHAGTIVEQCRGIPASSLRRYLKTCQNQWQAWCETLRTNQSLCEHLTEAQRSGGTARLLATLNEIATTGVLVRVGSTVLCTIGKKLDIPLALDVALQTARGHARTVLSAMAAVALRSDIPSARLVEADQIGERCDRLSDLLCGAMLPVSHCDRFAVDATRAADFAETYGRRPPLVRIPVGNLAGQIHDRLVSPRLAELVQRAIAQCLQVSAAAGVGVCTVGLEPKRLDRCVLPLAGSVEKRSVNSRTNTPGLSFPAMSFARSARKLRS